MAMDLVVIRRELPLLGEVGGGVPLDVAAVDIDVMQWRWVPLTA